MATLSLAAMVLGARHLKKYRIRFTLCWSSNVYLAMTFICTMKVEKTPSNKIK